MVPMTFTRTMRRLHRTEAAFALSLEQLAERHRAEAEVHHVAKDLAPWSRRHLHDLSSDARRHGLRLARHPGLAARARVHLARLAADASDRGLPESVKLVADLRRAYVHATEVNLYWEMVGQRAQAIEDAALVDTAAVTRTEVVRQRQWLDSMIKMLTPQALAS